MMITPVSTTSKGSTSTTTRHMSHNMTSMEDFEKKFSITVRTNALQYYGVGRTNFIIEAQQEDGRHDDGLDDIPMAVNKKSAVVLYQV
jgi:hypothetical protein